ncbi:MAG: SufE family protein [Flavobacteriales bacterium]|jgi:cysteine desulfuration protein SufE|nr:SufE family protein [Flavobacteriales bacterium]
MASVIDERQAEIADEFAMFGDWMEKYEHIISLGRDLAPMDESDKVDDNLIKGCQSRVWLAARKGDDGHVRFTADSDAIITKGLVALMVRTLSDAPAADIAGANLSFLDEIGLHSHLSPTRSNGLQAMVKQMKLYGLAFTAGA